MNCGVHVIIIRTMGQITIEIPQRMKRTYRIVSEATANEVLKKIDVLVKEANHISTDGILGLWADREESAEEIARELRRKSNTRSAKND